MLASKWLKKGWGYAMSAAGKTATNWNLFKHFGIRGYDAFNGDDDSEWDNTNQRRSIRFKPNNSDPTSRIGRVV